MWKNLRSRSRAAKFNEEEILHEHSAICHTYFWLLLCTIIPIKSVCRVSCSFRKVYAKLNVISSNVSKECHGDKRKFVRNITGKCSDRWNTCAHFHKMKISSPELGQKSFVRSKPFAVSGYTLLTCPGETYWTVPFSTLIKSNVAMYLSNKPELLAPCFIISYFKFEPLGILLIDQQLWLYLAFETHTHTHKYSLT